MAAEPIKLGRAYELRTFIYEEKKSWKERFMLKLSAVELKLMKTSQ